MNKISKRESIIVGLSASGFTLLMKGLLLWAELHATLRMSEEFKEAWIPLSAGLLVICLAIFIAWISED